MALEDGWTKIEAGRFRENLSVLECAASMEPDRFRVVGALGCTMAAHDDMKGLVSAVCVHGFA